MLVPDERCSYGLVRLGLRSSTQSCYS
jgi:hypothetical protein